MRIMSEELEDLTRDGYSAADWQKHYDEDDLTWDIGEVAPPFVRLWEQGGIPRGRMIVPGCGQGHEVRFFADQGLDVTGVDYARGAVERLQAELDRQNIPGRVVRQDFFELDSTHDSRYDILLEQTFFCAIHPDQRSNYMETACRILKPRGWLIGLFYATGQEGGPPFNTTDQDIRALFADRFQFLKLEKCDHSHGRREGKEWLSVMIRKDE